MSPEAIHQIQLLSCIYLSLALLFFVLWGLARLRRTTSPPPSRALDYKQPPDRHSQLRQHARWLVQLRWIACATILLLTLIAVPIAELLPNSNLPWLLGLNLIVVVSNLIFTRLIERTDSIARLVGIQIIIDMIVLTGLLNAAGGLENPLYFAYVFPVIVAGILLPRRLAFGVAATACLLFAVLAVGETSLLLPHTEFGLFPHIEPTSPLGTPDRSTGHALDHASYDPNFVAGKSLSFLALILVASYLTSLLSDRLRSSEESLSMVAREAILEHERLEGMVHAAGVGMLVLEPSLEVRWFSQRAGRWLGWQVQARGTTCPLSSGEGACEECVAQQVLKTGRASETERRIVESDGAIRYLRHAAEPVLDDSGRVLQVVELIEDTTKRRALEAEAVHAGKLSLLGQLAAGLAHEIGNPLASLTTRLKRLEHQRDPAFLDQSLALLKNHIERIGRTVRNVSLFSRNRPVEWELCKVDDTVEEAVNLIRLDRRARNITFHHASTAPNLAVYGVHDQLVQVLVNILLNAVESMPDGGEVKISSSSGPRSIQLTITDSGTGLAPELRDRIFEPFFTTKKEGVGLGLALSKSLIEAHGGDIQVRSEPGTQTRFTISLPLEPSTRTPS